MKTEELKPGAVSRSQLERKMSPGKVLAEKFGLNLVRIAGDSEIRNVGVRVSHDSEKEVRKVWNIVVDRRENNCCIRCDGETVLLLHGSKTVGPCRLEKVAFAALIKILKEKTRCAGHRAKDPTPVDTHENSVEGLAEKSKAALRHACEKHPKFADAVTCRPGPVAAREMAEWQMVNHDPKTCYAEYLLQEEVAEILDAYTHGNFDAAIADIHDAVAVLWRMALMIEDEKKEVE